MLFDIKYICIWKKAHPWKVTIDLLPHSKPGSLLLTLLAYFTLEECLSYFFFFTFALFCPPKFEITLLKLAMMIKSANAGVFFFLLAPLRVFTSPSFVIFAPWCPCGFSQGQQPLLYLKHFYPQCPFRFSLHPQGHAI